MLSAVAALVIAGGVALYWYSDSAETEGTIDTNAIPEPCDFVAGPVESASDDDEEDDENSDDEEDDEDSEEEAEESLFLGWVSQEVSRQFDRQSSDSVEYFECIYSAENSSSEPEYRLLTLYSTLEVHENAPAAREAHTGALQFESGEGLRVHTAGGIGERAAIIPVSEEEGQQEVRLHLQTANATASLSLFVSGLPPEDGDLHELVRQLADDLVESLPRETLYRQENPLATHNIWVIAEVGPTVTQAHGGKRGSRPDTCPETVDTPQCRHNKDNSIIEVPLPHAKRKMP